MDLPSHHPKTTSAGSGSPDFGESPFTTYFN